MTKQEEMLRFDRFIASLPADTYLRPWLAGIRDRVETDLKNDHFPQFTPSGCWEESRRILTQADKDADAAKARAESAAFRILEEAREKAAAIVRQAEREAKATIAEFHSDIHRLRSALDRVA